MTLNEIVLTKVAEWQRPPGGRQTLVIPDEGSGWSVTVTADRHDDLGCLLWEVALRRTAPAPDGAATLAGWAAAAAERVTGLLEPLKVHEVDVARNEALLRTKNPARRGNKVSYFEILLKGTTEAVVRRYQASWQDHLRRNQVCFSLTHEGVAQTTADLASDA